MTFDSRPLPAFAHAPFDEAHAQVLQQGVVELWCRHGTASFVHCSIFRLRSLTSLAQRSRSFSSSCFDCSGVDWFIERARSLGVEHKPPAPILLGRHLIEMGVQPGPRMGEILRAVYELQLDGVVNDLEDARREAVPRLQDPGLRLT